MEGKKGESVFRVGEVLNKKEKKFPLHTHLRAREGYEFLCAEEGCLQAVREPPCHRRDTAASFQNNTTFVTRLLTVQLRAVVL